MAVPVPPLPPISFAPDLGPTVVTPTITQGDEGGFRVTFLGGGAGSTVTQKSDWLPMVAIAGAAALAFVLIRGK